MESYDGKIKGKSFLITGGSGFLGSWLSERIEALGGTVTILDNLSSGSRDNSKHLKAKFIQADVCETKTLPGKLDYIIHAASIASPDYYQKKPIETIWANTKGLHNMLEIAKQKKVKGFLFTSTSEVYGNPPDKFVPTPETYYGNVNSYGPRSCYDEGKRCGEAYCYTFFQAFGTPVRLARIFNTYGPRLRAKEGSSYGRVIPRFVNQARANEDITVFGNGKQTRSFCYVDDQVDGLLRLLLLDGLDGQVVNIGNDDEKTIIELAKTIKNAVSSSSEVAFGPLPKDDPIRRCPDLRKAKKLLGFKPRIKLKEGLKETIGWMT
ncbi:MAG: NAD-dependent epimerase/dehydratase family protein [Candidatus Aenigmarchaeota archaeon]|nr:NAD-dependent epimerase/dehydratase family protein [Candidatus Aenigmarchaeota archaeon]